MAFPPCCFLNNIKDSVTSLPAQHCLFVTPKDTSLGHFVRHNSPTVLAYPACLPFCQKVEEMCLAQHLKSCSDGESVSALRHKPVSWGVSLPEKLKRGPILPFPLNKPSKFEAAPSQKNPRQNNNKKPSFIFFSLLKLIQKALQEIFLNTLLSP